MQIKEAERQIAMVLAELEASTGDWVEHVMLINTDNTNMDDSRVQVIREVHIAVRPKPGTRWAV